jgi:hypothetical protein
MQIEQPGDWKGGMRAFLLCGQNTTPVRSRLDLQCLQPRIGLRTVVPLEAKRRELLELGDRQTIFDVPY